MRLSEIRDMTIPVVVLCLGLLVLVESSQTTATDGTVTNRGQSAHIQRSADTRLQADVSALSETLASQTDIIEKLTQRLDQEEMTNAKQEMKIEEQEMRIDQQEKKIEKQEMNIAQLTSTDKYLSTELGCVGEEITLSCSDGKTLLLTSAEYGEYYQECGFECCPMHPYDCTEPMSTSNPDEWLVLKLACDLQTTCTYLFQGSTFVEKCTPTNAVDYLSIYYRCEPESVDDAVGFSAYATENGDYVPDDVILFDGIISNLGNHYDPTSSIFLCPHDGVYMFGVNVLSQGSGVVNARIMLDDATLVGALADDASGVTQGFSTLVVSQCSVGQKVWVTCKGDSQMNGNTNRYSTFTGYLLHRA